MNCCLSPVAKSRMPYMNIYSKSVHFILGLPLWLSSHTVIALDTGQLSCLLEPSQQIKVASEVAGVVRQVNFKRGDNVRKGDVLLSLEQGMEIAEINLSSAKVEFMDRKLQRNQELIDKGLLADFEVDEIITERELAALELKRAERSLEQKIIYSPVDAVVVDMLVAKSEYAGVEPLLVLAVLNPLHAEIVMSASYYGRVKKGMQVEIIPDGLEDSVYSGTVRIVDRIIDAASSTFGVQVEIPNPALGLPAGLKCIARFSAIE
jgi:membrane fusion protein (multidrug efflux system)